MATAGHALAALDAALAGRAGTSEVGVGDLDAGLAEEHPYRGRNERVGDSHLLGDRPHDLIGRRHGRVHDDTEHALGLVVERRQLGAPVSDVAPALV